MKKTAPKKTDQQLVDEAKIALNHYPAQGNYIVPQKLVMIVISQIDKVLTKNGRLAFLSYMYDRKVTTAKQNGSAVKTTIGEETIAEHAAVTEGLEAHEQFSILRWAQPAQLMEGAPWQVNACVREAAEAFQRLGLGQQTLFDVTSGEQS